MAVSPTVVATLDRFAQQTVAAFPPATPGGRYLVNLWAPRGLDSAPP
jgi:hypothetical protein